MKKEAKRGAIWLWGAPNSGKSTILKMFAEIFTVVSFSKTRNKFDLIYNQSIRQPQFVTIDEVVAKTFFGPNSDYTEAKLVMEGGGYICENKHKNA